MKTFKPIQTFGIILATIFNLAYCGDEDSGTVLKPNVAQYNYEAIPKDPLASAFFSATFPGTGQLYNKEYIRGIITGIGFYGSFYLFQYMYSRFVDYNTDTVYFAETTNGAVNGYTRQVLVPKPDDLWKWQSTTEKGIFIASIVSAAGFYVWGIIDSYKGANRYNQKLIASKQQRYKIALSYSPQTDKTTLSALYRF